jgi:hypothetical protein
MQYQERVVADDESVELLSGATDLQRSYHTQGELTESARGDWAERMSMHPELVSHPYLSAPSVLRSADFPDSPSFVCFVCSEFASQHQPPPPSSSLGLRQAPHVRALLRLSLQWQPVECGPVRRTVLPVLVVIAYVLGLVAVVATPFLLEGLLRAPYPPSLLLIDVLSALLPIASFLFNSFWYFRTRHFELLLLELTRSGVYFQQVAKRSLAHLLAAFLAALLLLFCSRVVQLVLIGLEYATLGSHPLLYASFAFYTLYSLLTCVFGAGAILTIVFVVYFTCTFYRVHLQELTRQLRSGQLPLETAILHHHRLRVSLEHSSRRLQLGLSLVCLLTLIVFIVQVYSWMEMLSSPTLYRVAFFFSFGENLLLFLTALVAMSSAANLTFSFEQFVGVCKCVLAVCVCVYVCDIARMHSVFISLSLSLDVCGQ